MSISCNVKHLFKTCSLLLTMHLIGLQYNKEHVIFTQAGNLKIILYSMHQICHGWTMKYIHNTESDLQTFTPNAPCRTQADTYTNKYLNFYQYSCPNTKETKYRFNAFGSLFLFLNCFGKNKSCNFTVVLCYFHFIYIFFLNLYLLEALGMLRSQILTNTDKPIFFHL